MIARAPDPRRRRDVAGRSDRVRRDPIVVGPTAGIALDYTGDLTPNWKDTFKARTWRGSIVIACEAKDTGLACKAIQVGGAFGDCTAHGWIGVAAQIRCEHAIRLAP